ncbi:vitelline membrane protein Vm26Ab [Drosophila elegans]|uniref:vitelline membrane protein Vm26Ab n=1 Tax=Drosophila elegans TaxID=30023 RepID=UPI0007E68E29|nr:vitelline membrane protein Vm26Ab [Drosophila elegans]
MAFHIAHLLIAGLLALSTVSSETIQLQPTQGILIPAPLAENIRVSRAAYGGYGAPAAAPAAASYAAPAAPAAASYAAPAAYSAPAAPVYSPPAAAPAYAAPAPAPASIPSPPCPKNYLFSCQPSLQPVPCSAPAPSYGSAGAYSQYVPQYAVPFVREL